MARMSPSALSCVQSTTLRWLLQGIELSHLRDLKNNQGVETSPRIYARRSLFGHDRVSSVDSVSLLNCGTGIEGRANHPRSCDGDWPLTIAGPLRGGVSLASGSGSSPGIERAGKQGRLPAWKFSHEIKLGGQSIHNIRANGLSSCTLVLGRHVVVHTKPRPGRPPMFHMAVQPTAMCPVIVMFTSPLQLNIGARLLAGSH